MFVLSWQAGGAIALAEMVILAPEAACLVERCMSDTWSLVLILLNRMLIPSGLCSPKYLKASCSPAFASDCFNLRLQQGGVAQFKWAAPLACLDTKPLWPLDLWKVRNRKLCQEPQRGVKYPLTSQMATLKNLNSDTPMGKDWAHLLGLYWQVKEQRLCQFCIMWYLYVTFEPK